MSTTPLSQSPRCSDEGATQAAEWLSDAVMLIHAGELEAAIGKINQAAGPLGLAILDSYQWDLNVQHAQSNALAQQMDQSIFTAAVNSATSSASPPMTATHIMACQAEKRNFPCQLTDYIGEIFK